MGIMGPRSAGAHGAQVWFLCVVDEYHWKGGELQPQDERYGPPRPLDVQGREGSKGTIPAGEGRAALRAPRGR
eukprot:458231-Prorocentrum_minimum.AAC.5